jgi:hypothetical protein
MGDDDMGDDMGVTARGAARALNPVRAVARLTGGSAKALARQRKRLLRAIRAADRNHNRRRSARLRAQLAKVEARLQRGSPNGGVDYGRLQPRREDTEGPVVLVIGIRKRGGQGLGTRNAQPLLAALGAEMYEATQGYTGPEAVAEMRFATVPSDFLRGDGAFPMGGAAPLPPPRRVGPEVYGG